MRVLKTKGKGLEITQGRGWASSRSGVGSVVYGITRCVPSSETQGQSVEPGEKARRKFSSTGGRAPGYRLSPDHFQTVK